MLNANYSDSFWIGVKDVSDYGPGKKLECVSDPDKCLFKQLCRSDQKRQIFP